MAITRTEVQVTWPTAVNSKSIAAAGTQESEAVTFNAATIAAGLTLKVDNDGTPASGDTVDFYIMYTDGDPDGASTDEYATAGGAEFLARLDTNNADPEITGVDISMAHKAFKLYAENNSAGRAITVSATMTEVRG